MGLMTRAALWLIFAAGVLLAACGLLPWYRFDQALIHVSGLHAHAVSGVGDGYLLIVLGTLCATLAAWMGLSGRLNALALIAIAAISSVALGVAVTGLTPGNICGPALYTNGSSQLACVSGSGDVFGSAGDGYVTGFVWLAIALSLFALLMALALPLIEDYFYEDYVTDEPRNHKEDRLMGLTTQNALRVIIWLGAALALLAFVPWLDVHTLNISADGPRSMTALSDAVLFASVALGCVFLASQMLRNPSELVWAGLVVASGVLFVFAGAEIIESTQGCTSNGTVLGFMNASFGFGCSSGGGYTLSAGQAALWVVLSVSALVAILALGLPIIESVGRISETPERAEQW
jgi:hypothetical protein